MALQLEQFRIEERPGSIVHFIFDMPGRSMNVFSNAAIGELGAFADWLRDSDVRGVVIRSGKTSAFCAGADLGELAVAYDMIVAARPEDRFDIAFGHFFPLSHAIRRLERAGKPVAVAIGGLALGGGCELALGGHYRVLAEDPKAALGVPESLVGLLPGGGGTQRLPRLVGADAALPLLLEGQRLSGQAAVDAGLVHKLAAAGEEVPAAEAWLLSAKARAVQPWDEPNWTPTSTQAVQEIVSLWRRSILEETLGHYPAPLAILDCVEQGLPQNFDAAIRTEMSIFAQLIQRPEPRDMIQTLFLGKLECDRATRGAGYSEAVQAALQHARSVFAEAASNPSLVPAGFGSEKAEPVQTRVRSGYWLESEATGAPAARAELDRLLGALADDAPSLNPAEVRLVDYLVVREGLFPAYLGGPYTRLAAARTAS